MISIWETKRLEEVVEFQRGLTYSKNDEVDFSENVVLRSNNVDLLKNELDLSELKYINPAIEVPESKKVKKGALIICTANGSKSHLGKVALIDEEYGYAFGGFMGLVTPKSIIDSKFLFYLMTSEEYKKFISELADGANINNLKFGDLGQFQIPLPPLPEQQRIVSLLDKAFAAIEQCRKNAEQNLQNAKELFESYLQGVFENKGEGWEEKSLMEIALVSTGKHDANHATKNGRYRFYTCAFEHFMCDTKRFGGECLILPGNGANVGQVFYYNGEFDAYQRTYVISEILIEPRYLHYHMLAFWKEIGTKKQFGSATNFIKIGNFVDYRVQFPDDKAQQTIVRQLDALRAETQKLEGVYRKKLEDLEELKKSILQKAFAGELISPGGAIYDNEVTTPLARDTDGNRPSDRKKSITSPEGA